MLPARLQTRAVELRLDLVRLKLECKGTYRLFFSGFYAFPRKAEATHTRACKQLSGALVTPCAGVTGSPPRGSLTPACARGACLSRSGQRVLCRHKALGTCPRSLPRHHHLDAARSAGRRRSLLWEPEASRGPKVRGSTAVSDSVGCQGPANLLRGWSRAPPCPHRDNQGSSPASDNWARTAALVSQAPKTELKPGPSPRPGVGGPLPAW